MFNMLVSSVVNHGFKPQSSKTENYKIGDNNDIRFVLDQHAELNLYSASSLKQQSMDRHVVQL
jgi:hypothetical protein